MRIIIISDTHGNLANLKKVVNFALKENIKVILHCGDIGSPEFLREALQNSNIKLFGVLGNMDFIYRNKLEIYNSIENIPPQAGSRCGGIKIQEKVLEIPIDNKLIAITHYPEKAKLLAESGKYRLVFYGHTHKPWVEKIGVCKLANPGELAGQLYKPCFAIYDAKNDFLELKILEKL